MPRGAPAVPLLRYWRRSTSSITHPRSPHSAEPRRNLAVDQKAPECRRSSTPACLAGEFLVGTLASTLSPLLLISTIRSWSCGSNRSLNWTSIDQSGASNFTLIRWLISLIHPNRYRPIETRHASAPDSNRIRIRIMNLFSVESCNFHIFRFIGSNIANNMSLESL
jgi:hypothetical protein